MQLSKHEARVLTAYTRTMFCTDFSDFHGFAEKLLDRPIFTHEFADENIWYFLKAKSSKDALLIFNTIEYTE